MTNAQIDELEKLVKAGVYPNRAEALRDAVRTLLESRKMREIQGKLGQG